jgi:hypothetical protein
MSRLLLGMVLFIIIIVVVVVVERLYTLSPSSSVIGCKLDDVGSICCRCAHFKCFWCISRRPSSGFVTF